MKEKQLGKLYEKLVSTYDEDGEPIYGYEEVAKIYLLNEAKAELVEILSEGETRLDEVPSWARKWFGDLK